MALGAVGMLGIGQGLLHEEPNSTATTPRLETIIVPEIEPDDPDEIRTDFVGEAVTSREEAADDSPDAEPSIQKLINVNTASAAELELLPRIGPVMAQRIIADRQSNGPFENEAELDRVSGIGPKTLEKLSPLISFD
jgi:competence ComEA-like helix-hairpin-helix protein